MYFLGFFPLTHCQYLFYKILSTVGLLEQNTMEWVAYKQQTFIAPSSGGWKSEGLQQDEARAHFQISYFFSNLHMIEGGQGALWSLFYKNTSLLHKGSTIMTKSPAKGPTSSCYHTERISTCNFLGGHKRSVCN